MEKKPKWYIEPNHFEKWQACGNDFILMSQPVEGIPRWKICDRHFGIGADGVIYLTPSEVADVRMSIINADGTEAEMCGNGIRCVGQYVAGRLGRDRLTVETLVGVKELLRDGIDVSVDMGEITPHWNELIYLPGREYDASFVEIGNPHCVLLVNDVEEGEVEKYGYMLENMTDTFPNKTNVEFVEVKGKRKIRVRVWERGCGRTLACGTGACASAFVANARGLVKDIVTVELDGGEVEIDLTKGVRMTGVAEFVYRGEIYPPEDV